MTWFATTIASARGGTTTARAKTIGITISHVISPLEKLAPRVLFRTHVVPPPVRLLLAVHRLQIVLRALHGAVRSAAGIVSVCVVEVREIVIIVSETIVVKIITAIKVIVVVKIVAVVEIVIVVEIIVVVKSVSWGRG